MQPPLVSVIIPAYNAERFIARTLCSVMAQTYQNLEIIVVDDGSEDRTAEIVHQFGQMDQRIHLVQQQNAGVAAARNRAIQQANGIFIAPIDADDLWHPENLEKQVNRLLPAPPSVAVVYAWSMDIDQCDRPLAGFHAAKLEGQLHATLLAHNFIGNASSTLMRRDALLSIGGYSEQFRLQNAQGCEDWDLYLRLAEQYEFLAVPAFLIGYRKLDQSMSDNCLQMARSHLWMLRSQQTKFPHLSPWLYRLSKSSFYLFFAHQNQQQHRPRQTLFWLIKAAQTDLTPLLRLGFYWLLIQSLWQLIQPTSEPSPSRINSDHLIRSDSPISSDRDSPIELDLALYSKASPFILWLKILVSQLLHRLIQVATKQHRTVPYPAITSLTENQWI
jgi:glycosyltransferase involved in cell wall biosynthesis